MDELRQLIELALGSIWASVVIWFSGLWLVLLFVRKVFKDADEELDPEKRKSLAENLTQNSNWASGSWIPDFTLVFDRFFGKKHLRWRCLYRSILISIVCFTVLIWLTGIDRPEGTFEQSMAIIIVTGVICNGFIDYWSLLETRILLNTSLPTAIKILVDVILTLLIALGLLSIVYESIRVMIGDDIQYSATLREVWDIFAGLSEPDNGVMLVRVIVATSFTTSIWLWLHGLAQLTIRGFNTAAFLMSWLNVKEKPLRAIGTTINAFVLLLGIVLFPVFVIAR